MFAMDRYVVIGNPVSHSLSPAIHSLFAQQTGDNIEYSTLFAPFDDFDGVARKFFDEGGRGANVTLPFKIDAFRFANTVSPRAELAGAANFLAERFGVIEADNTDGAGLVADLTRNLELILRGRRILVLGAGGAARGVIAPLLALAPERLVVANRTISRAEELARRFRQFGPIEAAGLDAIPGGPFDLVLNATSTSTQGEPLELASDAMGPATIAYDMAYGPAARAFLDAARSRVARASDGLGMLVEQAAESFAMWRGRRPETAPVIAALRGRAA